VCSLFYPSQGTLLVLDEPTNHLDIPSKETLEEAIRCFEGAVIAVSHDRYFLKRIATRVLLVSADGVGLPKGLDFGFACGVLSGYNSHTHAAGEWELWGLDWQGLV
jgi:ATPase subunit of ABC transporter with duplicated ATPase domains